MCIHPYIYIYIYQFHCVTLSPHSTNVTGFVLMCSMHISSTRVTRLNINTPYYTTPHHTTQHHQTTHNNVTRSYVWRDSFPFVTWLVPMCDISHFYVWHDSFLCSTCLIASKMQPNAGRDVKECGVTHSYVVHMTRSYVWRDSFLRVPWLVDMCATTELSGDAARRGARRQRGWWDSFWFVWHDSFWCAWHDSYLCVTWLVPMCDMTRSCMGHDSLICVTWLVDTCDLIQLTEMQPGARPDIKVGGGTHFYMRHDALLYVTWLADKCDMTQL